MPKKSSKTTKSTEFIPCLVMELPEDERHDAAKMAIFENPANAPMMQFAALEGLVVEGLLEPQSLAALTGKYWGPKGIDLAVSFMDNPSTGTINKILAYANLWGDRAKANVKFRWSQSGGQIRISRGNGGYYSYLGTDILSIRNGQTMNLQGFTEASSDAEYERVVVHEFGHTMGFLHEHLRAEIIARIDRAKALRYFASTQGWNEQTTTSNVLTPLSATSILATEIAEEDSVMCYQLPASITKDGKPIKGGLRLSEIDMAHTRKLYPRADVPSPPPPGSKDQVTIRLVFEKGQQVPDFEVFVEKPSSVRMVKVDM